MGMFNRRNAVLGWGARKVGKRVVKKKAKDQPRKMKKPAFLAGLAGGMAAIGGVLFFWRKKKSGGESS